MDGVQGPQNPNSWEKDLERQKFPLPHVQGPLAVVQVIHEFILSIIRSLWSTYYVLDIWMGAKDEVVDKQCVFHHGAAFGDPRGSFTSHRGVRASVMNNFDVSTKASLGYRLPLTSVPAQRIKL